MPQLPPPSVAWRPCGRGWTAHACSTVLLACGLVLIPLVAGAQEDPVAAAGPKPNWLIIPSVALDGTYTDNVNLVAKKKSDFITQLSPGISLEGHGARTSANLNYQWHQYSYADNSARNNLQRALAANGRIEFVENWFFLEGSHNTSQQSVSAFGTQSVSNALTNTNKTETASYQLTPYIKGVLGGVVDYQLRYSGSRTRSDTGALSAAATTTRALTGRLAGATPLAVLGWSLDTSHQVIANPNGFDSRSQRATGTLTFQLDPQFRFLVSSGRESDNYTSTVLQKRNSSGIGADWAPNERTKFSLKKDRHTFGDSFSADFTHRTELSAWQFSDSRNVRVPTPQMAVAQTGTAYDLLFLQLASSFPDPLARATATNTALAQAGIAANSPIFGQIQTSQAFIERRQKASLALIGANNTVTFAADRSNSQRMGTGVGIIDDFSLSSEIRQSGFNASWAHKMTPHAALTLNAGTSRSRGSGNLDTSLKSLSLNLTTQLGVKTTAVFGLRGSRFDSKAGTSYDERALTGAVTFRF